MDVPGWIRVVLVGLPMLAACVAAPVQAQESTTYLRQLRGPEIPMAEAQFLLYEYLAGSDDVDQDERMQDQVRSRLDIGNARFYALMDHMNEAIHASQAFADSQTRALCARRKEFATVKALAAALDKSAEELREYQAKLVEKATPILGSPGEARFAEVLAEYRQRMRVSRVDYAALLAAREMDAAGALDGICRPSSPVAPAASGWARHVSSTKPA